MKFRPLLLAALLAALTSATAQEGAPRDNPYDVIGKVFAPFWSVLLADGGSSKAMIMNIEMKDVTGRLPKQMEGATLKSAVQFPDKVRLTAPVLGEEMTVCRNGDKVWAIPGQKVEYLINQFKANKKKLPPPTKKKNSPLFLPFTAQQAIFLPALFTVKNAEQAEMDTIDGQEYRLITAGLMPQLAEAAKAQGFQAQIWVGAGYLPRRVKITQPDFTATVDVTKIEFGTTLQPQTWDPPAGYKDVYWTNADMMDQVLFVVMNSLKMKEGDQPWQGLK